MLEKGGAEPPWTVFQPEIRTQKTTQSEAIIRRSDSDAGTNDVPYDGLSGEDGPVTRDVPECVEIRRSCRTTTKPDRFGDNIYDGDETERGKVSYTCNARNNCSSR